MEIEDKSTRERAWRARGWGMSDDIGLERATMPWDGSNSGGEVGQESLPHGGCPDDLAGSYSITMVDSRWCRLRLGGIRSGFRPMLVSAKRVRKLFPISKG
jgi:hypothetical protein